MARRGQWFACHTGPRAEQQAYVHLKRQGYNAFFPFTREKRYQGHGQRRRMVMRDVPLFSRYIFVEVGKEGQSLYAVNKTSGVATVVHIAGEPLEIPAGVIDELMARTDEGGLVRQAKAPHWFKGRPGDTLELSADAPYYGLIAQLASVADVDKHDQISIFLDMLGAKREITVPVKAVARIIAA